MSHFSVLVPANGRKELEDILLPYHEYECTGIEAYIEFVPLDDDDLAWHEDLYKEPDTNKENLPFGEWMENEGYTIKDGVFGRWTNPNRKWDWWTVGGRWSGLLVDEGGDKGDIAAAGQVAWRQMREQQAEEKQKGFARLRNSLELIGRTFDDFHNDNMGIDDHNRADIMRVIDNANKEEPEKYASYMEFVFGGDTYDGIHSEEEAYHRGYTQGLTFAYIDLDGNWHERARMGWWGMTSDDQPDYDKEFWAFVESLEDDQIVVVVDCHI